MSKGLRWLFTIALYVVCSAVVAAPVLKLDNRYLSDRELLGYIDIYEDIDNDKTIEEIMSREFSARFAPANLNELYFGYTTSAYWLRLSIENTQDNFHNVVLQGSPAELDLLEMFVVNAENGQIVRREKTGSQMPLADRAIPVENLLLLFHMQPSSTYVVYLRASSNKSVNFRLSLGSQDEFVPQYSKELKFHTAVIVSLLVLACIALWLGLMLKQRSILYVAGYIGATCLVQVGLTGMASLFLPASADALDSYLHICANTMNICVCLLTATLFAGQERPTTDKLLKLLAAFNVLGIVIALIAGAADSAKYCSLVSIVSVLIAFFVVLRAHLQSKPLASVLLMTRTVVVIALLVAIFNAKGYLPLSFITEWGMALAVIFEGSLAMAALTRYQLRHHLRQIATLSSLQSAPAPAAQQTVDLNDICHELRTPISGVLGMTELLMNSQLSEQQRSQLTTIQDASQSLIDVTNKIDALGTLQQGMIEIEVASVCVTNLLDEVIKSLQTRIQQRNIEIILQADGQVAQPVLIDADKLRLILSTALQMAIRHVENGEIVIGLSRKENAIEYSLNTSSGNEVWRVDQPLHLTSTDKLNLAILESYVKVLNGQFANNSQAGHIAFNFSTQVKRDDSARDKYSDNRLQKLLVGKRLLVTDDNATCCTVIEKQATSWGMIVHTAASGKETLAKLHTMQELGENFDILLIDYDMPHINGLETIRRISEQFSQLPKHIFLLTGMNKTVATQASDLPIEKILFKPINGTTLKQHLIDALQR